VAGTRRFLEGRGVDICPLAEQWERLEEEGKTVTGLARAGQLEGLVAMADTVKPSAAEAVAALKEMGLRVMMITGDNWRTAAAIADRVGIERRDVLAEVLPADKAAAIQALRQGGGRVGMVGDGINDAPALATADLGLAMGSGTDAAIEAAQVTLMRDDPRAVPAAIRLGRATLGKIKQNLFWALGYNVLGIPVAALGLLDPIIAGAAMALSSVSVVTNALLLRRFNPSSSPGSLARRQHWEKNDGDGNHGPGHDLRSLQAIGDPGADGPRGDQRRGGRSPDQAGGREA
jgi:Cu+-exporting ATPase